MTSVLAGSVLDASPGKRYIEKLRFAELALAAPLPRPSTLRRWRAEWPAHFHVALRAPSDAIASSRGGLVLDEASERALAWTLESAEALRAVAVVFPTPLDVTPGQRSRDLMRTYFGRFTDRTEHLWVWEPSGLWEPSAAFHFAGQLGVACAYDPLVDEGPAAGPHYVRLLGVGARSRFSVNALERAYEQIAESGCERAFVAIQSQRSVAEAAQLQQIADAGGDGAAVIEAEDLDEEDRDDADETDDEDIS